MADKKVESGFPVDGGAGEKLACLADLIAPANIVGPACMPVVSLKLVIDNCGLPLMAGFSVQAN